MIRLFGAALVTSVVLGACVESEKEVAIVPGKFMPEIDCTDLTTVAPTAGSRETRLVTKLHENMARTGQDWKFYRWMASSRRGHSLAVFSSTKYSDTYLAYAVDDAVPNSIRRFEFGSLHYAQTNPGCDGLKRDPFWTGSK